MITVFLLFLILLIGDLRSIVGAQEIEKQDAWEIWVQEKQEAWKILLRLSFIRRLVPTLSDFNGGKALFQGS